MAVMMSFRFRGELTSENARHKIISMKTVCRCRRGLNLCPNRLVGYINRFSGL